MELPSFFIPTDVPSSKNSKIWTGKFLVNSKATQRWKRHTRLNWEQLTPLFQQAVVDLEVEPPYYIEFGFIRRTKRTFDYINMAQILYDTMVHYKWMKDDDVKNTKPYFADWKYDKNNPGVIIKILKYKPEHYGNIQTHNTAD